MAVGMFGLILLPFVFTLLVILLIKAPKIGAVLVGAILFLGLAGRLMASRGGVGLPGFMEVVIVAPFAFVLLVLMLSKAPKVATGVIVAILVAVLAGLVFLIPSHRRVAVEQSTGLRQFTESYRGATPLVESYPVAGPKAQPPVTSPIWSEGLENEYEADFYPSRLAAVRALGRRMCRPLAQVIADMNTATKIVLFQDENDGSLATPFKQALAETLPDIPCSVVFGSRNIDANEIGITLRSDQVVGSSQSLGQQVKATVSASARHRNWEATVRQSFVDKPWMENFSSFASSNPLQQFIVARSWETCTSPVEARDQALQDAAAKLQQKIGKKWIIPGVEEALTVGQREVEDGGFIVDLFLQSFDGVSGRFWRHAMLIDASPEKLKRLDARMSQLASGQRMSWARMILSALGILVVIVATYLFLNMATRGYYVWSLRIAGTVLAIAGIVSIILVLR